MRPATVKSGSGSIYSVGLRSSAAWTTWKSSLPIKLSRHLKSVSKIKPVPTRNPATTRTFEIAILAGGRSSRMGRDKSKLRLGRHTLIGHVKAASLATGFPVRVIRRDLVPHCGPLSGIYTALKGSRAEAVVFLACDMPWVSPQLIRQLLTKLTRRRIAVFCEHDGLAGFPFVLRSDCFPVVEVSLKSGQSSLQKLAASLVAHRWKLPKSQSHQLANLNTVAEWKAVKLSNSIQRISPGLR